LIGEVERVADIVAIMRAGRVVLVERLDELKSRTRELTVTVTGAAAPPTIPGEVLRTRRRTRQWQVLARDITEAEVARLQNEAGVVAVESRTPSLEEIFVAVHADGVSRGRQPRGARCTADAELPVNLG
jgi:ABC-type multidrug transport system ATPase subunit